MNVDPELRKRVEQIKSSPVQLYREAGDYSNRELVEGIVVSPDDIAAIEAVARDQSIDRGEAAQLAAEAVAAVDRPLRSTLAHIRDVASGTGGDEASRSDPWDALATILIVCDDAVGQHQDSNDPADAAHRMVQPDHYQRWER